MNTLRNASSMRERLLPWPRALRCHQWVKNLLVFLPAVFAHRLTDGLVARQSCTAVLSFSLMASAVYLFNDWKDRARDALHPVKKFRPQAAGLITPAAALGAGGLLVLASVGAALSLPPGCVLLNAGYAFAALAYSCWWKRLALVDVFALAAFYTARIYAGSLATGIEVSGWMLLFSMFIFLSLGLQKRLAELLSVTAAEKPLAGRGYITTDIEQLRSMGQASGFAGVLVCALYVQSAEVSTHYANPSALWWMCPLILFWLCRLWLLTGRGEISEDAIVFALGDRASLGVGALAVLVFLLAKPLP